MIMDAKLKQRLADQQATMLAERTALLRLALVICKNQDGTDEDIWATWAAMARNALGEQHPDDPRHPENEPGLRECLRTVHYHRVASGVERMPVEDRFRQGFMHALERVENTIKAELENGGPLTSSLMGGEPPAT